MKKKMNPVQKANTEFLIAGLEKTLDIIRHELAHGGVNYYGASRALIEIGKAFRRVKRMKY